MAHSRPLAAKRCNTSSAGLNAAAQPSQRRAMSCRINAAARLHGLSYSRLINGLNLANIEVDRKVLADIAVHDPEGFGAIAEQAKAALAQKS